jgi:hypothetical protein
MLLDADEVDVLRDSGLQWDARGAASERSAPLEDR